MCGVWCGGVFEEEEVLDGVVEFEISMIGRELVLLRLSRLESLVSERAERSPSEAFGE